MRLSHMLIEECRVIFLMMERCDAMQALGSILRKNSALNHTKTEIAELKNRE